MKRILMTIFCLCIACCVSACGGHRDRGQRPDTVILPSAPCADDVKVELPANYSQKNYKRLIVAVHVEAQQSKQNRHQLPLYAAASSLETEIAKLKRFTIVSRQGGQKGLAEEKRRQKKQAATAADAAYSTDFGHALQANYVLWCRLSCKREENERYDHNEFLYIARLDYQLIDVETEEIVDADYTEGRAIRTCVRLPSGKIIGGFDPRYNDEQDPVSQAAIRSLQLLGYRLGCRLPIGGKVTTLRGGRFQINKGVAEGFVGKQFVTMYMTENGLDIPLAAAEIKPGEHSSAGEILQWTTHPDDQDLVKKIQTDPFFTVQHDVYVVTQGMPLPPEWEQNYAE
ncbi:MAG: hypothetical protein R3Y11_05595 [Pseudomonadota bacterium]